jgi:ribonuclease P protein component
MGLVHQTIVLAPNPVLDSDSGVMHSDALESRRSSVPRENFPRTARLTEAAQFASMLAFRPTVRNARFAIHLKDGEEQSGWRLGLIIPKRWLNRSVARNVVRRVWREAFRKLRPELEKQFYGHDILVRLVARPKVADLCELRRVCAEDAQILLLQVKKAGKNRIHLSNV